MKRILFLLVLMCLEKCLHAQAPRSPYIYTIKADSVKITNSCDTAELIIENHTQTVPGFLFNKGRGRTEFRRIAQLDDTSVVVGGDTIHLGRGSKNFANADLTFDDDHWHDGALHNVSLYNFGEIGFQTNDADFVATTDMRMNPIDGYSLYVSNNGGPQHKFNASHNIESDRITMGVGGRDNGMFTGSNLSMSTNGWGLSLDALNPQTGENYYGGISYDAGDGMGMDVYSTNGRFRLLTTDNRGNDNRWIEMINNGDSVTLNTYIHYSAKGTIDDTLTRFTQSRTGFTFEQHEGINNFKVLGLPASSNSTDSMLVIDNSGQVKKRAQSSTRKSATVTASAYTVPADVDVVFVNYTGGTATISLPSGTLDREITIKNLNTTNSVILSGLDPSESNTVATRGAITVKYTGSTWVGISKY